jgi:hypothetical protein
MVLAVSSLDVALAGVVTTGLVGLLAPLVGAWVARGNREHERTLARDERVYAAASGAYEALLTSCARAVTRAAVLHQEARERAEELRKPKPPVQDEPDDPAARRRRLERWLSNEPTPTFEQWKARNRLP